MTKAVEEFREWIRGVKRTQDGEPRPVTDDERNLMAMAFISGWHKGRMSKEES